MSDRVQKGGLEVATVLADLVANDIAPGTGVEPDAFWAALENMLSTLSGFAERARCPAIQDRRLAFGAKRTRSRRDGL